MCASPCRYGPRTSSQAAIRTERDAVAITGSQILFHRTVRQTVNIHELQEQVNTNEGALSATIASVQAGVTSTLAANTAAMQSRMDAAASTAAFRMDVAASTAASTATSLRADVASAQSSLAIALDRLATTTAASVSTMNVNIGDQLSTAAAANLVTTRALNVSVQAAIVAANNAAVPSVYIQWGAKACTAPSSVTVTKLCEYSTSSLRSPAASFVVKGKDSGKDASLRCNNLVAPRFTVYEPFCGLCVG